MTNKPDKMFEPEPGLRLKRARIALKLKQDEFGAAIGRSRNTIVEYEKGRAEIPGDIIEMIKMVYNVNPRWLRTGEGEMFVKTFTGSTQVEIGGQIKEGGFIAAPPEDEVAIIPDNHEKITRLRSQVADTIKKTNSHPGIKVWAYAGAGNPFNADPDESEPMEKYPHYEDIYSRSGRGPESFPCAG